MVISSTSLPQVKNTVKTIYKMSFLRGSTNYVWCTTSVLGKGATGAVFQGVNKNNGEPVAVKTFNQLSHMRPQDVQMREFEVLKKVKHENIVKLLAIEEEQEGRGKVIVMELCTGGSLFNILDDPENTYGLQEKEFLLVVEHLSAGMKHLRDNNLVHRDLKPGNIMKFIAEDGSTIYKLTDFGAARELHEDQQFMSLYGTEEYLHPDMYERAVLRKPVGKTFGATVDLWSIGVTLYHVATGNLPFRPYGGRKNKETMHFITTEKASGVISGTQTSENGPIDWGRELPSHCELSDGLKKIVTPLLAGLLEVDANRIWSFEKFFNEVTLFLARKIIHIFYVNKAKSIKVFLHLEDTLSDLQQHIQEQTGMIPASQLLLLGNKPLTSIIEENTPGRGYPETSPTSPVMLFSRDNNNVMLTPHLEIPKFPIFPNLVSVENDASMAKAACSVGHVCKRRIESLSLSSLLMSSCVNDFTDLVEEQLKKLHNHCEYLQDFTNCIEDNADTCSKSVKFIRDVLKSVNTTAAKDGTDLKLPSDELRKNLMPAVQQLHHRYVNEHTLSREWKAATRSINAPNESRAENKSKLLIERLRDSWQHLLRDRATRTLTYNDEQFHVLERIKIMETGRRVKNLLDSDVLPAVNQTTECLADWYKMAHTVFLQTRILEKDVSAYEQILSLFSSRLHSERHEMDNLMKETIKKIKSSIAKSKSPEKIRKNPSGSTIQLQNDLKTLMSIKSEISTGLNDNWEIIQELVQLASANTEITDCDTNNI